MSTSKRVRQNRAAIEQLERRRLLSSGGYTTETVASFSTIGLKYPDETIVRDSAGNIFGIARGVGSSDGAVWEIPASTGKLQIAASFNGTDGSNPSGGLFKDTGGNIYGVCDGGGANNKGTLWELPGGQSTITLLASFSTASGSTPMGQIYVDSSGDVFGANEGDILGPDYGNVWEFNASSQSLSDLADFDEYVNGANPMGGVISDGKGDLFGTAYNGGPSDDGTVWQYNIGSGTITALAAFNAGSAGANPAGGIAIDSSGDLFGTSVGPANSDSDDNVWELPAGGGTINTLAFFPVGTGPFFYGASPMGPVTLDSNGDVVGTTEFGGAADQGSVWAIHPGGALTTLHSFTFAGGHDPASSLLLDSAGDIFGTTQLGRGGSGDGTAFLMIPPGIVTSTHLAFTVQPVNTQANGNFTANVQVTIEGAGNRVATMDDSAVTLSISKGPGTATLGGTVTVDAVDGVATFTGLSLDAAGTYQLKATDGILTPATSKSFMVPTVVHLVAAQQPENETAGSTMATPVVIDVDDQFGKPLTTSRIPVKVAIQSGPTLAKLLRNSASPVGGVATFTKLSATKAGAYALTVSDGTATPLTLNPFTVNPAAATKMVFSTQPVATTGGTPFSTTVELFDKFGNIATNDASDVTLSLALHPAAAMLDGTLTEPVIDGLADFAGLSITTTGTYSLLATDSNSAVKPVKSVKFAVS